jgi:TatA/E family protein of Tat protein translocase
VPQREYPSEAMLATLGPWQFVILVVIILFLFGSRRVARALRSLKTGGREFKRGLRGKDELPPP